MDEHKNIRVYAQDPVTHNLEVEKILELTYDDKQEIKYSEFDEYVISHSCVLQAPDSVQEKPTHRAIS